MPSSGGYCLYETLGWKLASKQVRLEMLSTGWIERSAKFLEVHRRKTLKRAAELNRAAAKEPSHG